MLYTFPFSFFRIAIPAFAAVLFPHIVFATGFTWDLNNPTEYTAGGSDGAYVVVNGGTASLQARFPQDIAGDLGLSFDVSVGDLDGDGDPDLYVANSDLFSVSGDQNRVWINDGTGRFASSDIAGDLGYSRDAALGDLDGDGDLDIFVANSNDQQNRVWINDGTGHFTAQDIAGDLGVSQAVSMADFDADGDLDLYVANLNSQNRLWINDGTGHFTSQDIAGDLGNSNRASVGDLDGDGDLDLYVVNSGDQNRLWINDGTGHFTAQDIAGDLGSSYDASLADFDSDGDLDIYVTNSINQQNRLWINDGTGHFTAQDIAGDLGNSYRASVADFDGDGDLDVYTPNFGEQNRLWINDGTGHFTASDITGDLGNSYRASVADFDGDGNLDLYVVNFVDQNRLWINDGTGHFTAQDIAGDLGHSYDASVTDFDGDGDLDIYVANYSEQNRLFINGFTAASPYVQPTAGSSFALTLQGFVSILGAGNQGAVTFQVSSDNGTTWQYWDGSAWTETVVTDGTETSTAVDINANIATLDTDGGTFTWRAYLNSNGNQSVELDAVSISLTPPPGMPDLQAASDSGYSSTDNLTTDTTPEFDVTCQIGATVSLYSEETLLSSSICGTGTVSFMPPPMPAGLHSVTARQADAGYISPASPPLILTIDNASPIISNEAVTSISNSNATIAFETNEPGSTLFEYGLAASLGTTTAESNTSPRVLSHSQVLTNLLPCTTYFYRALSIDDAGNPGASAVRSFTTSGCTAGAGIQSSVGSDRINNALGTTDSLVLNTSLTIDVPAGFSTSHPTCPTGGFFQFKKLDALPVVTNLGVPTEKTTVIDAYEFSAYCDAVTRITTFDQPISVMFHYENSDIEDILESSLAVFRHDGSTWHELGCTQDINTNTMTCLTTAFSPFALFGASAPPAPMPDGSGGSGGCRGSNCRQRVQSNPLKYQVERSGLEALKGERRCDQEALPAVLQKIAPVYSDQTIVFQDVRTNDWFACAVYHLTTQRILSGYHDETGRPLGEFRPGNSLSYAEALKLAVLLSEAETLPTFPPRNRFAREHWAAAFVSYAEQHHFTLSPVSRPLDTPITRAQFLQTISDALDLQPTYSPEPFVDVPATHPQAAVISYAFTQGWITGDTDSTGITQGIFRPDDVLTRADAAVLVYRVITGSHEVARKISGDS